MVKIWQVALGVGGAAAVGLVVAKARRVGPFAPAIFPPPIMYEVPPAPTYAPEVPEVPYVIPIMGPAPEVPEVPYVAPAPPAAPPPALEYYTLVGIIQDYTAGRITGTEAITRCYNTVLSRAPDAGGFQAHLSYLTSTDIVSTVIAFVQGAGPEFRARIHEAPTAETLIGIIQDYTAGGITGTEAITRCYNTVLSRAPEAAGLQAHLSYLTSTGDIVSTVIAFVQAAGPEFRARKGG